MNLSNQAQPNEAPGTNPDFESRFPCRRSRREFVWQMGAGLAGTALATLLCDDGFFGGAASAQTGKPSPPRIKPHFPSKVKSVIFLMMNGGPSHVDTFDFKPSLAKYAGQELPPSFQFINSGGRKKGFLTPAVRPFRPGGKSGLMISDFFPKVREHADKLALIRSCHTDSHAHGSALVAMNTGSPLVGKPSLGSWAVYGMGSANRNLPGYVVILDKRGGPISGQPNWGAGYMPAAFQGTLFRPVGDPVLDLRGPLSRDSQRAELDFLQKLNHDHQQARPGGDDLSARIQSYELAFRMQSEVPEAVDLSKETSETLALYGVGSGLTDEFVRVRLPRS